MVSLVDVEDATKFHLTLRHEDAEELASAFKELLRESRQTKAAMGLESSAVYGHMMLSDGTEIAFMMVADPAEDQKSLSIAVAPGRPPTKEDGVTLTSDAPEVFKGYLTTSGERALFIGELSRCARLARLQAEQA
jgi:hypothetical protein